MNFEQIAKRLENIEDNQPGEGVNVNVVINLEDHAHGNTLAREETLRELWKPVVREDNFGFRRMPIMENYFELKTSLITLIQH